MDSPQSIDEILKKMFKKMDERMESEALQAKTPKETTQAYLKRKIDKHDWKFKTFEDKALIKALAHCKSFCLDIANGDFRWLTLSGPTEVGKTHLAKKTYQLIRDNEFELNHRFNYPYVKYICWSEMIENLFKGNLKKDTLQYCGLLVIEDFLSYRTWNTQWQEGSLDSTYEILNLRLKKPTLIDTNKSHSEIMSLDPRIGSRLLREGSKFYEFPKDTKNFLSRC
jgi:DNA replication protein DnaC